MRLAPNARIQYLLGSLGGATGASSEILAGRAADEITRVAAEFYPDNLELIGLVHQAFNDQNHRQQLCIRALQLELEDHPGDWLGVDEELPAALTYILETLYPKGA